jgi:hypothetical protein
MSALLVTYDLKGSGGDYSGLLGKIKSYPSWARLSESSYAIATDTSPQAVFSALKPFLDANDNIYVITLKQPYSGYGPKEVNDWLDKHLAY